MLRSPYAAGGTYHVFLSFAGHQSREAARLVSHWIEELLHTTVRVFFYGPDDAVIGRNWEEHVFDGAEDSDALIVFLTKENIDGERGYWINLEIDAAQESRRCTLILFLLLDGLQPSDLPEHLRVRQAKPWSSAMLKNLLILIGREAHIKNIEVSVKAHQESIDASFARWESQK